MSKAVEYYKLCSCPNSDLSYLFRVFVV